jgi:hypothetical protein
MLKEEEATTLVDRLRLDRVPSCPLCLLELAWAMREGRVTSALVRRTTSWVWPEIEDGVRAVLVAARMREVPHAEDALHDLERGTRGLLARQVVTALAWRLCQELQEGPR